MGEALLGAMRSAAAPAAVTAEEAGGKADQPGSGEEDEKVGRHLR